MDDKLQKERLEQELKFLKESFEAEVISKEEFEKGKDRIERKLKAIQKAEQKAGREAKALQPKIEEQPEEQPAAEKPEDNKDNKESLQDLQAKETISQAQKDEKAEAKIDDVVEYKDEEKIKLKVIQEEPDDEPFEPLQAVNDTKEAETSQPEEHAFAGDKKKGRFLKYTMVFVVLVVVIFFSYSLLNEGKQKIHDSPLQAKFTALCNVDDDCRHDGKIGFCLNPATKDAKCEFRDIPKTNVTVLNGRKDCFNCDPQRVLGILENWFGPLNVKEADYSTEDGKKLAEKIDAQALPAYVFDESLIKNGAFAQYKQTLAKKDGIYVLSQDVAAPTFYFKRDSIPNKLELFVISGDNAGIKAENNVNEFIRSFPEVKFEKHLSSEKTTGELGIKIFPAFLINNRIRFSGVQTAETIKNNFCRLNKLPECSKTLSKSLV